MGKKGSSLEKAIQLIQETFKDSENTKIHRNFKIENEVGNKREIDILIESVVNGFEIKIAIECKDHKDKIPVKEIEAFKAKCDRIKHINKKIFVSSKGFQKDAVEAANYFGIELLTAEQLDSRLIHNIITIRQLKPIISPEISKGLFRFNVSKKVLSDIIKDFNGEVYIGNNLSSDELQNIIMKDIEKAKQDIFSFALLHWMKLQINNEEEVTLTVNFSIKYTNLFLKHTNGDLVELNGVDLPLLVKFSFIYPTALTGRTLKESNGKVKAEAFDIILNEGVEGHIVKNINDNFALFISDGQATQKLEKLLTYDPITGEFIDHTKNNCG